MKKIWIAGLVFLAIALLLTNIAQSDTPLYFLGRGILGASIAALIANTIFSLLRKRAI